MGSALRLHPLLVIFGLLAGGEIYGSPASWSRCRCSPPRARSGSSSRERVELEPWRAAGAVAGRGRARAATGRAARPVRQRPGERNSRRAPLAPLPA